MTRLRGAPWVLASMALGMGVAACTAPAPGGPSEGVLERPDGASIAWWSVGEGPVMLIVHGGPGLDHRYLRPGLDVLADAHRLVYWDQRAVGASPAPLDTTSISLARFVEDLDALRAEVGGERALVLGHSFGTLVALAHAFEYPERVAGLILLNPVDPGGRFRVEAARLAAEASDSADARALRELMASDAFRVRDPATMEQVYRLSFRSVVPDPAVLDLVDLTLDSTTARNGPEIGPLLGATLGDPDWWPRLPGLDVPTLVVHARYEPTPLEMSEALAEALPRGSLAILETGHFPYVEAPEDLRRVVTDFTAALPR